MLSLRIQISAILFQVDCAINQFVISISESCYVPGFLSAEDMGKSISGTATF